MRMRSRPNPGGTGANQLSQVVVVSAVVGSLLAGLGLATKRAAPITAWQWPLFVAGLGLVVTGTGAVKQAETSESRRQGQHRPLGQLLEAGIVDHHLAALLDDSLVTWWSVTILTAG